MTTHTKLTALHDRLTAQQDHLLALAAASDVLPPFGMIRTIADLDAALRALDVMLEEQKVQGRPG